LHHITFDNDDIRRISNEPYKLVEGIARGEMAVADGRVVKHAQAKERMVRWLKDQANPSTNAPSP